MDLPLIPDLKVELLDPVVIKGALKEADFIALGGLADEIVNKHREHNIIKVNKGVKNGKS